MAWGQTARVQRVAQEPKLDDFPGGGAAPGFVRITDFRQNKPDDGKPASRETIASIAYDDQNFCASFLCIEKQGKIGARLSKGEDIFSDDEVSLYPDTFHDKRHALSFT
jgi:hypothetical protein